jgi:hypothetical protein
MNWEKTCKRFVAVIDFPGLQDAASGKSSPADLRKLELLRKSVGLINYFDGSQELNSLLSIEQDQTKPLFFSDSIIIFSKGPSVKDFIKIITDSYSLRKNALKDNVTIRVAISFGTITIDFGQSLFVGQPIIDAYLLLEDLFFISIVIDHNAQKKANSYRGNSILRDSVLFRKAESDFGSMIFTLIIAAKKEFIIEDIAILKKLYNVTSETPRFFINNTIDYYEDLLQKKLIN